MHLTKYLKQISTHSIGVKYTVGPSKTKTAITTKTKQQICLVQFNILKNEYS